jgi:arylsulfatase A-like enzyme/Tfp pilus assembly protein PilF
MFRRTTKWLLITGGFSSLAAAAITAVPGCAGLPGGRDEVRPLNVVVVTLDTLSARHLSQYGNERIATPAFGRAAAEGVLFEQATATVPLTLPSHTSMFTGTYPMFNGVRDNGGYYVREDSETLAEALRAAGYQTGAFVAAFVVDSRWGLDQGFDRYFDDFNFREFERISLDSVQRPGDEVLDAALDWMDGVKEERFFSWIHLYDPHWPYEAPEPWASRVGGYPEAAYDAEVLFTDSLVGQLLDWLDENELAEDTLLVLIGDHGESLGRHREGAHGFFVYDAAMQVPFLLRAPYRQIGRGLRVPAQVRGIDLMPTVLDLVGVPVPGDVQGASLVPLADGTETDLGLWAYSESFYPRNHYGWSPLRALRNGVLHFISAPRPELFEVLADPGETTNLAPERPGQVRQLQARLDQLVVEFEKEGADEQAPETLDEETRAQLAALGYLGGSSRVRVEEGEELADPKDKIVLYNLLKEAGTDSTEDRIEEAMAKVGQVLAEDPGILEAHLILGNLFVKQEDWDGAVGAYREALTLDPEYKSAILGLADAYRLAERYDEAAAGYRRLLELDPNDNKAFYHLAEIHAARAEYEEALEVLAGLEATGEERAPARNLKGECLLSLGRLDEAEAELRLALEMDDQLSDAWYNLALLFEERGDGSRAIEAYETRLEMAPRDFRSHFNVAKLYGAMGDPERMEASFRAAIEHNSEFGVGHLYLSKVLLDRGELAEAEETALRGLALKPEPEMAPLGHFVLADIYNRQGRTAEAEREVRRARSYRR